MKLSLFALLTLLPLASAHAESRVLVSKVDDGIAFGTWTRTELRDDGLFYRTSDAQTRPEVVGRLKPGSLEIVQRNLQLLPVNATLSEGARDEACDSDGLTAVSVHDARFPGGALVILRDDGCQQDQLRGSARDRRIAQGMIDIFSQVRQ